MFIYLYETLDQISKLTDSAVDDGFKNLPLLEKLLSDYLAVSNGLAGLGRQQIIEAQRILGRAIIVHAYHTSPVYKDKIDPETLRLPDCLDRVAGSFAIGKDELRDGKKWFTENGSAFGWFNTYTSGTTGSPFPYRLWSGGYWKVEKDHHYKMILTEMGIKNPVSLFVTEARIPDIHYHLEKWGALDVKVADGHEIKNPILKMQTSHGSESDDCYNIIFSRRLMLKSEEFFDGFLEYVKSKKVNVLLAGGMFFDLLVTYLVNRKDKEFPHLFELVSNTGNRVNPETLMFLKESGISRTYCDHMRSWDGGASFFTCREGTVHLQDDLSYVFCKDGKLASIDFLSYSAPFVNYQNGDSCTIDDDYQLCQCGRWYRPFHFDNGRSRVLMTGNGELMDTDSIVHEMLGKYHLPFVAVQDGYVMIEESNLPVNVREQIVEDMSSIYMMVQFFKNDLIHKNAVAQAPLIVGAGDSCGSPYFACNNYDDSYCGGPNYCHNNYGSKYLCCFTYYLTPEGFNMPCGYECCGPQGANFQNTCPAGPTVPF